MSLSQLLHFERSLLCSGSGHVVHRKGSTSWGLAYRMALEGIIAVLSILASPKFTSCLKPQKLPTALGVKNKLQASVVSLRTPPDSFLLRFCFLISLFFFFFYFLCTICFVSVTVFVSSSLFPIDMGNMPVLFCPSVYPS